MERPVESLGGVSECPWLLLTGERPSSSTGWMDRSIKSLERALGFSSVAKSPGLQDGRMNGSIKSLERTT